MSWQGLIPNATPNTIAKAFVINGIASALIVAFTVNMQSRLPYSKKDNKDVDPGLSLMITMLIALAASVITYLILFILVGYGTSMVEK